jgi:carbon monoxide dehydrogenase subunit G
MRTHESVTINRPPDEVWAFLTDLFNSPRVAPGLLGFRRISPGELGSGSVVQGRVTLLGFEIRTTMTVTEWDPPRRLTYTVASRPIRRQLVRLTLDPIVQGTRMDRTSEFELHPALMLLWPILGWRFRSGRRLAARNFKRLVEATPHSASSR